MKINSEMRISIRIAIVLGLITLLAIPVHSQEVYESRPKIGLVLSGGGAKGLAHVGVLKVLEEAGIRPDYIGGTSMGGIVGGLYAIGYTVDSLDHLARTIPWNYYLTDYIARRDLTIEEKEDQDRFVISFPIKENKILIPSGMIHGQNIENLFNRLCAPVYDIRDFSKFNIPFICLATDIETGKEVILKDGYLPTALRATMSIPSIFNPVEINNHLLVDGGLLNNFPTQRVKEMGADIIIGVDVGFQSYSKKELTSILRIMEQSMFFYGMEMNNKNKSICDILISPDIEKYNASSFNSTDSIIAIGERAARKALPKLKALADSLSKLYPPQTGKQILPYLDSLQFNKISFTGLEKVSPMLVSGKLQINELQKVTPTDIEKAISRIYSSLYFEKVSYEIRKNGESTSLALDLKENKGGLFRVGIHYDSYYNSAILLNTTFRNFLISGSKLSISTALGEYPYFRASIIKNNGWKPGYGVNFESNSSQMFTYRNSRKVSEYNYSETKFQLFTQSVIRNSYSMGMGIELETSLIKPIIDPQDDNEKNRNSFINYYGYLNMDSFDHPFYPSRGMKFHSGLKFITSSKDYSPIVFFASHFSIANKITDRINLVTRIAGGTVNGDSIPPQYTFYTGGLIENMRNGMIPFAGLDYMERADKNAFIAGIDIQLRFWKNIYLILRANGGNLTQRFDQLLSFDNIINGFGLTFGYNSFIGPIEFSTSWSTRKSGTLTFARVGIYF